MKLEWSDALNVAGLQAIRAGSEQSHLHADTRASSDEQTPVSFACVGSSLTGTPLPTVCSEFQKGDRVLAIYPVNDTTVLYPGSVLKRVRALLHCVIFYAVLNRKRVKQSTRSSSTTMTVSCRTRPPPPGRRETLTFVCVRAEDQRDVQAQWVVPLPDDYYTASND